MSTWTRRAPEVRREEILTAARRAFADHDYAAVSLAAIAREVGVTPGLVNHYFGTKRELHLAVLGEIATRLPAMVSTDLSALPTDEMVDRNTRNYLDSVERDRDAWALLFGAQARRDPQIAELVASARNAIVARMARNHTGDDPPAELLLALRVFQGTAETAVAEWRRGHARRDQVHALLSGTLLAMVTRVTPSIPRFDEPP